LPAANLAAKTVVMAAVSVVLPWSTADAHVDVRFACKLPFLPNFHPIKSKSVEGFYRCCGSARIGTGGHTVGILTYFAP
jgi:hypothetical protein